MRRGKVTIHKKWDQNIGILSGDLLMIFAFKMLEDIEEESFKKTFKRFNNIAIKVCEGQQYDMNFESKNQISNEETAKLTIKCLKESVPNEVPGIAFLSGGQSEVQATENLNLINKFNV